MLYKGILTIKQFIKSKCTRFGIKCLPLNARNRYMYDLEVYQGEDIPVSEWVEDVNGVDNLSMSEKIVVEFLNRNYFLKRIAK